MKIRIWGARGSVPTPLTPDAIEDKIKQAILGLPGHLNTSDPEAVDTYVKSLSPLQRGTAGGNTACVEIDAGEEIFIIDAGSGLRELGQALMHGPCGRGEGVIHFFFSHPHWDHIQGFPFFTPAFIPGNRLFFYSIHNLENALEGQQLPLYFPVTLSYMQAERQFITINVGQKFSVGPLTIQTLANAHPGVAYSYRFEDKHSAFVYASDAEYKQLDDASIQPTLDFFRNADALVFDAQYTLKEAWQRVDWGHSSAMIGVDMARAANVKRLLLFHHNPAYSDAQLEEIQQTAIAYQSQNASRPQCEVLVAYEGMMLDLTPSGTVDVQALPEHDTTIFTPTSAFDESGVAQVEQHLVALSQEQDAPANPIIDLSQVETLTIADLKSLIALHRREAGTQIVLANPSKSAKAVIKLSGYLDLFAIYPSVDAAQEAIQAREALNLPGHIIKQRYRIENRVGEGRLGTVLKATDFQSDQTVAVQVLSPMFSDETIERFIAHAQDIINLEHSGIVKVFDWDRTGDFSFKAEAFMPGQTLRDLLLERGSPLPMSQAMEIVVELACALEYAHSCDVTHGDLKTQNVFMSKDGPKLSNFGMGRLEEGRDLLNSPLIFLSAAYLAPEQIRGQAIGPHTDLYALGVILFELLTGHRPFTGSDHAIMQAHLNQQPPAPSSFNPAISASLEHLILKLMSKSPSERYASATKIRRIANSLLICADSLTRHRRQPFVDRATELQTLQDSWQQTEAGSGQLIILSGNAGIGKTALAIQAAQAAHPPVFVTGRCRQFKGSPPYQPFIQALRRYFVTISPDDLNEETINLLGNLAQLMPDIHQLFPNAPLSAALEPSTEKRRMQASLLQILRQLTQQQPWFIVLDDLQWADESTLDLLAYLGQHAASMALLLVGIFADETDAPATAIESLAKVARHLPLASLDEAATAEILSQTWQQPIAPSLAEKIHRHADGNPLYIKEIARGLVDDGLITLENGAWHIPALDDVRLPLNVRDAIWRRIHHLNPDTQTLLRIAAVLGQTFRLVDLQAVSSLSMGEVLGQLDMALERQFLREAPGEPAFTFEHAEIQYVLYADIGPARRRVLHQLSGQTLQARAQTAGNDIAEELANHFAEADDAENGLIYSAQAAQRAQAIFANAAAREWHRQALSLLEKLPAENNDDSWQDLRLSELQSMGNLLLTMGQPEDALTHFSATRRLLESQPPSKAQNAKLAALCRQTAPIFSQRGEVERAIAWLDEGLCYIERINESLEAARIYLCGAAIYWAQADEQNAFNWTQQGLNIAARFKKLAEGQQLLAQGYALLSDIYLARREYKSAAVALEQNLGIYRNLRDAIAIAETQLSLARLAQQGDSAGKARVYLADALATLRDIGTAEDVARAEKLATD